MREKKRLVCGVGLNDANYEVRYSLNGTLVECPFYKRWKKMLERCYSEKFHSKSPSYINCSVCDEWLIFSNFKQWMEQQDWQGKELDKDIINTGNKIYSADNCSFVDKLTNSFVTNSQPKNGRLLVGVCFKKKMKKFDAKCGNPFTKKSEHLGYFTCAQEAHEAWKKRKRQLAFMVSKIESDKRVVESLIRMFN